MKPSPVPKEPLTPLILTPRHEQILRAIQEYRYATAQDITNLLFSKGSLTYVRHLMSALAGGKDQQARHYLYRFPFPTGSAGNRERIFTLGALGRNFLANELGMPVDWYFRPYKSNRLSHSHVLHHVLLTRFVIATKTYTREHPNVSLLESRLCHELARSESMMVGKKRKPAIPAIIPDALLLFVLRSNGAHYPVMLEIDRGSEFRTKFKRHLKARLDFIRSGEYKKMFDHPAVIVAYVASGARPEHMQRRVKTMAAWAQAVLTELDLPGWGVIFRFTAISLDTLYEDIPSLLEEPVWYRPDKTEPVPLFS